MKAIVLVAGYASRLYPLTLNTPKALLTLNQVKYRWTRLNAYSNHIILRDYEKKSVNLF